MSMSVAKSSDVAIAAPPVLKRANCPQRVAYACCVSVAGWACCAMRRQCFRKYGLRSGSAHHLHPHTKQCQHFGYCGFFPPPQRGHCDTFRKTFGLFMFAHWRRFAQRPGKRVIGHAAALYAASLRTVMRARSGPIPRAQPFTLCLLCAGGCLHKFVRRPAGYESTKTDYSCPVVRTH